MDNLSPSMTFSPPVISPSPLPTDNPSQLGNGSMVESSVDIPPPHQRLICHNHH